MRTTCWCGILELEGYIMPTGETQKAKTHCPIGHEYNEVNTYFQKGRYGVKRQCRACAKERKQRKLATPEGRAYEAAKMARWRKVNPDKNRITYQKQHAKKKQILDEARSGGCIRCGESDVACLDFHHRNGKVDKLGHIGVIRKFAPERIKAEIAKCDVLCANCHRKYHRDERQAN